METDINLIMHHWYLATLMPLTEDMHVPLSTEVTEPFVHVSMDIWVIKACAGAGARVGCMANTSAWMATDGKMAPASGCPRHRALRVLSKTKLRSASPREPGDTAADNSLQSGRTTCRHSGVSARARARWARSAAPTHAQVWVQVINPRCFSCCSWRHQRGHAMRARSATTNYFARARC